MTAHAKLSASGAHRWMNCPGSVKAEEGLKESTSPFAEEGTRAHDLMEMMLTGKPIRVGAYDLEMWEYVESYVSYVLGQKKPGDALFIERRVNFSEWVPDGFGTSDAIVLNDTKLSVIDLKFGKGHRVEAHSNMQPTMVLNYIIKA